MGWVEWHGKSTFPSVPLELLGTSLGCGRQRTRRKMCFVFPIRRQNYTASGPGTVIVSLTGTVSDCSNISKSFSLETTISV
jgi:hypothetical protein